MNTIYIHNQLKPSAKKAIKALLDALNIEYDFDYSSESKKDTFYSDAFAIKVQSGLKDIANGKVYYVDIDKIDELVGLK